MKFAQENRGGSILVTATWIMAILSLLAMGIGFRASLEVRLSKYHMDRLKARYLAEGGVMKAKELMSKDANSYDNLYECGISLKSDENPESVFSAASNSLGDGAFSVGLTDEERKININMGKSSPNVSDFRTMLRRLSPEFTDEAISAIIDWQDADSNISMPGGAENDYYEGLGHPYKCKNADFEFVEELLLVKGMTRSLFDKIKDHITVYTDGKVNVNTAPALVLNAIIGDDILTNNITNIRKGSDGIEGTKDDIWFANLNAFLNFPETDEDRTRLTSLSNYFTVKSSNFRVVSSGSVAKVTKIITCVINMENVYSPKELRYYHED